MRCSLCLAPLFVLLYCTNAKAQPSFTTLTGGLRAEFGVGSVSQGGDQVVAAAVSDAVSGPGCSLFVHDANGAVNSTIDLALPGRVFVQSFIPSSGGGGYLAGSVIPDGEDEHDLLLVRINAANNVEWTSTVHAPDDQQLFAVTELATGGVMATGVDNASGSHDVMTLRMDGSGNMIWSSVQGGPLDEEGLGIAADALGAMITGRQLNFGDETDALLYRFDLSGNLEWQSGFGGIENDIGHGIIKRGNGTFVMAGSTDSYGMQDHLFARKRNVFLIGLESDGDTLWTKALGDTLIDRAAFALAEMPNGNLLVVGERGLDRATDALAMRTTSTGDVLWEQAYDTGDQDRLVHVRADPAGFRASGRTFGSSAQQVLFLRRDNAGQ
ncbi:MAG: hypothetical protein IPK99_02075 [Flavobacteriales bacterium]|nr:hypothetical protein [Flavobacteriales bacterium]